MNFTYLTNLIDLIDSAKEDFENKLGNFTSKDIIDDLKEYFENKTNGTVLADLIKNIKNFTEMNMTLADVLNNIKEKIKIDYLTNVVPKINETIFSFNEGLTEKLFKLENLFAILQIYMIEFIWIEKCLK